jgi:hypothetical protein
VRETRPDYVSLHRQRQAISTVPLSGLVTFGPLASAADEGGKALFADLFGIDVFDIEVESESLQVLSTPPPHLITSVDQPGYRAPSVSEAHADRAVRHSGVSMTSTAPPRQLACSFPLKLPVNPAARCYRLPRRRCRDLLHEAKASTGAKALFRSG